MVMSAVNVKLKQTSTSDVTHDTCSIRMALTFNADHVSDTTSNTSLSPTVKPVTFTIKE